MFGILSRIFIIGAIIAGALMYLYEDAIGDIPFSELTLNVVFPRLIAAAVAYYSITWLFNPPKADDFNPAATLYDAWAKLGLVVFALIAWAVSALV